MLEELKRFVDSENEAERYTALKNVSIHSKSWQESLATWQILALIPTEKEKARLVQSVHPPEHPSGEWAIISYLLFCETDPQVLESCILSLADSRNCSLFHRLEYFLENQIHDERVLLAYTIYAEETYNFTIARYLERKLSPELSDSLKARIFNLFIKLGIVSPTALQLAKDIFYNGIENQQIAQKSMVSGMFYLFFAGNKEVIESFHKRFDDIKNQEMRRLIAWGLSEVQSINTFSVLDAKKFILKCFAQKEHNFSGYGCFDSDTLLLAIKELTEILEEKYLVKFTQSILSLGNKKFTASLAASPRFGISHILATKNNQALSLWLQFSPTYCEIFCRYITNPIYYDTWRDSYHKNIFVKFFNIEHFISENYPIKSEWQALFESYTTNDLTKACELIYTQITALEKAIILQIPSNKIAAFEEQIIQNIKLCIKGLRIKGARSVSLETFIDQLYGTTIGGKLSSRFMTKIYQLLPFSGTSWAFTAIALTAPKLKLNIISAAILRELKIIKQTLIDGKLDKEEYILEVTSRFQSILVGSDRFQIPVNPFILNMLRDVSNLIQQILDKIDAKNPTSLETNEKDDHNTSDTEGSGDWSGHTFIDRPILRWNAILQVCLNNQLTQEEKDYYEKIIKEALRIAPHVEKRWVVRALVQLDTSDAIKAVLYHALQHIDQDFVEITVRELLRSHHPRAQQALIRMIGKNTISDEIKQEILEELYIDDSEEIINELKSLLTLRFSRKVDKTLQDTLARALERQKESQQFKQKIQDKASPAKISSVDIDLTLKQFLPDLQYLSVDSRSALRTAEMILIQSREWGNVAVDLSPIVNMHCKAVELTMRETFEAYTDALIRRGVLSKKLDALGYGKPVPEKMQAFEDYLGNLPIIRTIPYFSKFKLRKMLRAICLFHPGKRFTLDGPKAFALFLLVTARKSCPFQLEDLFELNFPDDNALFELIKLIHSLQDSRNRAVHEGLTWEAKDDIETMRGQAYAIISSCLQIGRYLLVKAQNKSVPMGAHST